MLLRFALTLNRAEIFHGTGSMKANIPDIKACVYQLHWLKLACFKWIKISQICHLFYWYRFIEFGVVLQILSLLAATQSWMIKTFYWIGSDVYLICLDKVCLQPFWLKMAGNSVLHWNLHHFYVQVGFVLEWLRWIIYFAVHEMSNYRSRNSSCITYSQLHPINNLLFAIR